MRGVYDYVPRLHCQLPTGSSKCCNLQERDRRKEKWAPRWFQPSKDTQTHEDEYPLEDCPMWDFTGDYLKLPRKGADPAGESPLAAQQDDHVEHGPSARKASAK